MIHPQWWTVLISLQKFTPPLNNPLIFCSPLFFKHNPPWSSSSLYIFGTFGSQLPIYQVTRLDPWVPNIYIYVTWRWGPHIIIHRDTLPETNILAPETVTVGIRSFPFGTRSIFRGKLAVSFREGHFPVLLFFFNSFPPPKKNSNPRCRPPKIFPKSSTNSAAAAHQRPFPRGQVTT